MQDNKKNNAHKKIAILKKSKKVKHFLDPPLCQDSQQKLFGSTLEEDLSSIQVLWKFIYQVLCNPVDKPTNKQTEVKHNCLGGVNNCYQPIAGVAMVSFHWLELQVRGGNVNSPHYKMLSIFFPTWHTCRT